MIMDYFTVAALILMSIAVYLVYRHKRRNKGKSIPFQKKRPAARKRRRHGLLDRDRGKVIAFPGSIGLLQKNGSGQNSSGQNGPGQNSPNSRQDKK
jgi:hypothetical protein